MSKNTYKAGWLYRTEGQPSYIVVEYEKAIAKKYFPDSKEGAHECALHITQRLGHDNWTLEQVGFLGYRILAQRIGSDDASLSQAVLAKEADYLTQRVLNVAEIDESLTLIVEHVGVKSMVSFLIEHVRDKYNQAPVPDMNDHSWTEAINLLTRSRNLLADLGQK